MQRRVRGASPPAGGRPSLAAAGPVAREAQFDPGSRLRIRWEPGENFRRYLVHESCRFEDAGEVQHLISEQLDEGGTRVAAVSDWYDLSSADAVKLDLLL